MPDPEGKQSGAGNPEAARQDDGFIAVSETPDPCKTPPSNAPVPYHLTADLDQALSVSPDVKYQGIPVVLVDQSKIAEVVGDASGSGGGVKSGTREGEVQFVEGASTLKVNGRHPVRVGDPVTMNKGNTTGRVLGKAAPAGGVAAGGQPQQPANPMVNVALGSMLLAKLAAISARIKAALRPGRSAPGPAGASASSPGRVVWSEPNGGRDASNTPRGGGGGTPGIPLSDAQREAILKR